MPDSFSWKGPYVAAVKETDKAKLIDLVHAAEGAIFLRLQELGDSADHHQERAELKAACEGLLSMQVNKLGWPSHEQRDIS